MYKKTKQSGYRLSLCEYVVIVWVLFTICYYILSWVFDSKHLVPPLASCGRAPSRAMNIVDRDSETQPALLYAFPGAGEEWLRLVVEFATGTATGNVYTDPGLIDPFVGETRCDRRLSMIYGNPLYLSWYGVQSLGQGGFRSFNGKCKAGRGKPIGRFRRALFMVRDPYATIFDEYMRLASRSTRQRKRSNSFTSSRETTATSTFSPNMLFSRFDKDHFIKTASYLAYRYAEVHTDDDKGGGILRRLEAAQRLGAAYQDATEEDFFLVRYEDIRNTTGGAALDWLGQVISFIDPDRQVSKTKGILWSDHDWHRLGCAHVWASGNVDNNQVTGIAKKYVTMQDAYSDEVFVCSLWEIFSHPAVLFNYKPFGKANCNTMEMIFKVKTLEDSPTIPPFQIHRVNRLNQRRDYKRKTGKQDTSS